MIVLNGDIILFPTLDLYYCFCIIKDKFREMNFCLIFFFILAIKFTYAKLSIRSTLVIYFYY